MHDLIYINFNNFLAYFYRASSSRMFVQSVFTLLISLFLVAHTFRVVDPISNLVVNSKLKHTEPLKINRHFLKGPEETIFKLCASFVLLPVNQVLAKSGELGFLEGKTVALIHPIIMIGLFGMTLYNGYLGIQIRRLRDITESLKTIDKDSPECNSLVSTRKNLVALNPKDKHFSSGSNLLGVGVVSSLFGAVDTYWSSGELFPDSHLFGGLIVTALWALGASLAPAMQKGNNTARVAHITINSLVALLFVSQVNTGFEILQSVWEEVPWP